MVLSIKKITSDDFLTKFDTIDTDLVSTKDFIRNFGEVNDYVEVHVYSSNNDLLFSNHNFIDYKLPEVLNGGDKITTNSLILDPVSYINSIGFVNGLFKVSYNIFRKKIYNSIEKPFFIKEISPDRTEIRLGSNILSNVDIESGVLNFMNEIQSVPYYKDFLINFGDNEIVNAINIALDKSESNFSILVKLYKPLDTKFTEKNSLWIVEELSESYTYELEIVPDVITEPIPFIKSANFNVDYKKDDSISSDYFNINDILSNSSLSAYQKILNAINSKQIKINVDYSDYKNFIHFSSAKERLLNFRYKLNLIEKYNSDISSLRNVTNYLSSYSVSSSLLDVQNKITNIIEKFDGYENYLYYESSSISWPKSGSSKPYSLYPVTSSIATTWIGNDDYNSVNYGGMLYTASLYDIENTSNINFSTPEFINIDERNASYQLFLNMIGQHFDNIWIYIKAITDTYDSKNAINKGVSRDLVYNVLKGLGVKLYNSSTDDNIFDYLLGVSVSGSYLPVSESNQTLITASYENISGLDYNTEIFKRIYHNINYLLKTKGTSRGIKALITTFGIPSTILDVTDYGGSDKDSNTIEYSYDRFTYALNNSGSSYLKVNWSPLSSNYVKYGVFDYVADSVEFRFKPDKNNIKSNVVLLSTAKSSSIQDTKFAIWMDYTSSNSIPSANLKFGLSGSSGFVSSSITVPVYMTGSDNDTYWWNVLLKRKETVSINGNSNPQTYYLYIKNNIGDNIGHQYSSSIYVSGSVSASYNDAWTGFGTTSSMHYLYLGGVNYTTNMFNSSSNFAGKLQEFRLWSEPLDENVFDIHVLNPESIQGNDVDSSYKSLSARFPLGNNLLTYNHFLTSSVSSVHPNYRLSYSSGSFTGGSLYGSALYGFGIYGDSGSGNYTTIINSASFYNYSNIINYTPFEETYFTISPNSGYYNPVNKKVRISNITSSGYVLSPDLSFEDKKYITKDIHITDVSFSPQNEIDKDIIAQYGNSLNIDDYIGDPRFEESSSYDSLEQLKKDYYAKFYSKYNYKDYIKLIKYFDGSLFKMIKDFKPARTNIQTGITFKSPILERNKIKRVKPVVENNYNYHSGSLVSASINVDSNYTSGYGDGKDFYNGELSGSMIDVNNLFEDLNHNQYLHYTESLDHYRFEKSDYNVLYANVSSSVFSNYIKKQDINSSSILYKAEVQDYYYEYKRHANPRYDGSRISSQEYNKYNDGDISFDKASNVDLNVSKFGWLNKVSERNLNFYDKTTLNIKYLIDSSSNVYELNRANNNIFEVQNTFKSGDLVNIVLFNAYSPTVQISLEGLKPIWQGGFTYSPIVYREGSEDLQFNFINPTLTYTSPLGMKSIATASVSWTNTTPNNDKTFKDTPTNPPSFTINGFPQATPFSLNYGPYTSWGYPSFISFNFAGYIKPGTGNSYYYNDNHSNRWFALDYFLPYTTSSNGGYVTSEFISSVKYVQNSFEKYVEFTSPKSTRYQVNVSMPFEFNANHVDNGPGSFKVIGILEKNEGGGWQYVSKTKFEIIELPLDSKVAVNTDESYVWYDPDDVSLVSSLKINCVIRNQEVDLSSGGKLRIKFYFLEKWSVFNGSEVMSFILSPGSANSGYFEVVDIVNTAVTPISNYTITNNTSDPFITGSSTDQYKLIFNRSASIAYANTIFTTASATTIHDRYSEVSDYFTLEEGDIIRFGSFFTVNPDYYTVASVTPPTVYYSGSSAIVSSSLQVYTKEKINPTQINAQRFAILRKKQDETTIILNYNKQEGATSKGILIPYDLRKDVVKNTGNILKPIKDTLLLDNS